MKELEIVLKALVEKKQLTLAKELIKAFEPEVDVFDVSVKFISDILDQAGFSHGDLNRNEEESMLTTSRVVADALEKMLEVFKKEHEKRLAEENQRLLVQLISTVV